MQIKKQIRRGLPMVGVPPYGQIHLHSTGNRKSTAQNEADYMGRKNIYEGFFTHVVGNGQVIQTAETNRGAWDVGGDWNQWGYAAIELIESHKNQAEFDRDYKLYIELARKLADEANIPKKLDNGNIGIITHDYARRNQPNNKTDHVDPYPYLAKWGISRQQLRKDIENGVETKDYGPQGPWIAENKRVKVVEKGEKVYSGFDWKLRHTTDSVYGKEYKVTGKYHHKNGFTYYSLYDDKGKWHGYINKGFVKEVGSKTPSTPTKGKWIKENGSFYIGVTTPGARNIAVSKLPLTVSATGNGAKIADITKGNFIKYDAFMNDGKYIWIRQPRGNGYGYMATGNVKNGVRYDYWGKFA